MKNSFAFLAFAFVTLLSALPSHADSLPSAPTDPQHPGSKIYSYGVTQKDLKCSGREVNVFIPTGGAAQAFPVVVYGHGQALGVENYRATLEHLAKKGVIAIFPNYDSGFFDQDWTRMGRDYSNLAGCAITQLGAQVSAGNIVFAGHSKGAYVASIAAGLAEKETLPTRARSVVLFEAAGADAATLSSYNPATALTVVFSDSDSTVARDLSETIYAQATSHRKQFIFLKSYPTLKADHMWPLTKGTFFGGGPESALHYYGEWKWLVAAAQDLTSGAGVTNPYLYGALAGDKGVSNLTDDIRRSFQFEAFEELFDTANLTLQVSGLKNDHGNLLVSLFNQPAGFPDHPEHAVKVAVIPAVAGSMAINFPDLAPGTYAVSVVHDENGNGKLDTNAFGMPTEGFGFSNNPQIHFRAPTFDETKFSLGAGPQTATIKLNHF